MLCHWRVLCVLATVPAYTEEKGQKQQRPVCLVKQQAGNPFCSFQEYLVPEFGWGKITKDLNDCIHCTGRKDTSR